MVKHFDSSIVIFKGRKLFIKSKYFTHRMKQRLNKEKQVQMLETSPFTKNQPEFKNYIESNSYIDSFSECPY